jgi:hypothetical protein
MHYQSSTYIKANISCISYHIALYGDHVFVVINFLPHNKKKEKKRQIQKYKRIQIKKTPKIAQVGDQNK